MKGISGCVYKIALKNKSTQEMYIETFAIGKLPKRKKLSLFLVEEKKFIPMAYFTSKEAAEYFIFLFNGLVNKKPNKEEERK